MVKRGGTKKKIAIEKIHKFDSLRVTFTKRRDGLFSKASQLCLLSGAQIVILATPPSSESNVSFYSFGHSSVDTLVSAFLSRQRPAPVLEGNHKQTREDVGVCLTRKDLGLGLWWEEESLNRSENPEELRHAIDSMWTLLSDLKELKTNLNNIPRDHTHQAFVNDDEDLKKKEKIDVVLGDGKQEPDQTLILQSITPAAICCIPDDIIVIDDDDDSPENFNKITEEQYQINEICESFGVTDNNNTLPQGNLDYNQEIDIEQLIDFDMPFEISFHDCVFENTHQDLEEAGASLLTNSEIVHDDHVSMETTDTIMYSYLEGLEDEDDLQFSDLFNNIPTIAPL